MALVTAFADGVWTFFSSRLKKDGVELVLDMLNSSLTVIFDS